jgi:hypothetical protein
MGWAVPEWLKVSGDTHVEVSLNGVCTCAWRRENCDPRKECYIIHDNGHGEEGSIRLLRRLMGKKFPKVWAGNLLCRNDKQWALRRQALDKFAPGFYKKCRPVQVEVRAR